MSYHHFTNENNEKMPEERWQVRFLYTVKPIRIIKLCAFTVCVCECVCNYDRSCILHTSTSVCNIRLQPFHDFIKLLILKEINGFFILKLHRLCITTCLHAATCLRLKKFWQKNVKSCAKYPHLLYNTRDGAEREPGGAMPPPRKKFDPPQPPLFGDINSIAVIDLWTLQKYLAPFWPLPGFFSAAIPVQD